MGRTLFASASKTGAEVLGIKAGVLAPGYRADLVAVAMDNPMLADKTGDRILDTLIFGVAQPPITDVFVAGKRVIQDGKHALEETTALALRQTMRQLCAAI